MIFNVVSCFGNINDVANALSIIGAFTALSGSMENGEGSVRENELEMNWFQLLFCGYLTKIINIMVKFSKWQQEESLRTSLVLTKATGIKILQ